MLIASSAATHAELALPYLERGLPTFIEKPLAISISEAERIAATARRSGAPVFVGHIYLYNPAFSALLDLLPGLGPIRYVLCEGMNHAPASTNSVLWEWLPHHLSMGRAIFAADPDSAEGWTLADRPDPRAAVCRFLFRSVPLVSSIGWLSPAKRRQVTVSCEQGTIVFDDSVGRKLVLHRKGKAINYPAYDEEPPLTRELRLFLKGVRARRMDRDHLVDGMTIVRAIAGAEQSLRERRLVAL